MDNIYIIVNRAGTIFGAFTKWDENLRTCVIKAGMKKGNDLIIARSYVGEEIKGEFLFDRAELDRLADKFSKGE